MKLYDFEMAPNPRRVRIFMAEKGIEIPTEQVDLASRAQMEDDYKKINPRSEVPVLELDDGTFLTEAQPSAFTSKGYIQSQTSWARMRWNVRRFSCGIAE